MQVFEILIAVLLGSAMLSVLARRLGVPYPTLLAVGGAALALLPTQHAEIFALPPDLILALFVAPILLDAAHDTSLRDLCRSWRPLIALVLVAVVLTTAAVAYTAHLLIPGMPLAAAIALGALVAPPDAVAAMAVLRHVKLPHRIRAVLEGESLLNDASALLIYKLAVGAVAVGSFSTAQALPTFALVVFGSVLAGWVLARIAALQFRFAMSAPVSVILQFSLTFGVWILAERLGLSGVVTIVVFGFGMARHTSTAMSARLRISSFAIWESVTFILNILAFTLIGLQMRPILDTLGESQPMLWQAFIILAVVILVRLAWVMLYALVRSQFDPHPNYPKLPMKSGLLVGWSGMRGIVTLAAAMALPESFPQREFIELVAFVVVLGTLLLQGLTLQPLLTLLRLPQDDTVEHEVQHARASALKAAMAMLQNDDSTAAHYLTAEYREALERTHHQQDPYDTHLNTLRKEAVIVARKLILQLHHTGDIGDEAYRQVEEELDWLELSASAQESK